MTQAPAPSSARPPRPPRRAPSDLPFRFADAALADRLATDRGEPGWLRTERLAAATAFESLPIEANQLYTPYVDLRSASLEEAQPYLLDGPPSLGDELRDLQLPEGVHVETMAAWLLRDP